jgi:hypothetical protein
MLKNKYPKGQQYINKFDIYGSPIPGFNFEQNQTIGSIPGIIFSILTALLMILYAGKKLEILFIQKDALIS